MGLVEIGLALNIMLNLAALGYAFGALNTKVDRNTQDIQALFSGREKDAAELGTKMGKLKAEATSGHQRLRKDVTEHEKRLVRLEARTNGGKA